MAKANGAAKNEEVQKAKEVDVDAIFDMAKRDEGGFTLVPTSKALKNTFVMMFEPRIERGGMVVVKVK